MSAITSDARLQAHWALQIPAAAGHALAEPQDDDSQSSFLWSQPLGAFVGNPLGLEPLRVGLAGGQQITTTRTCCGWTTRRELADSRTRVGVDDLCTSQVAIPDGG